MTTLPTKLSKTSTTQWKQSLNKGLQCHFARTPLTFSVKADVHTTDLTDQCPHRVLLKHEQKIRPVATTALYRGLLAGKVLEAVHDGVDVSLDVISKNLTKELEEEGRVLSDSVAENMAAIELEVSKMTEQYHLRLMPLFDKCEVIGTELPCRLTLGDTNFASHVDLLVRDTNNVFGYGQERLLCIDWKFRQDAPTKAYLSRNLQMFTYWLTILEGSVMAYKAVDGWVEFGEEPQMIWCHLPYLKPFGRKTVVKNDEGEEVTYKKGDERPIANIMREVNLKFDAVESMKRDMLSRVAMMRAGFFPKNPDPIRCQVCEAQDFCARGDTPELLENK